MKTTDINRLVLEVEQDEEKEKLCLIEDIIRVKRTMWAFGHHQHDEFLSLEASGQLFNELYDYDIERLELILNHYSRIVTNHANKLIQ